MGIIIVTVDLDDTTYSDLIQILNEKYYSTTDIAEMQKINNIYKELKFKSESWLSAIQPNNFKQKRKTEYGKNI